MQDSDPKHTSKKVQEFFKEKGVNWWKTPAESLDCNPIENLWHKLKEFLRREIKPTCKDELVKGICKFWEERVDVAKCQSTFYIYGRLSLRSLKRRVGQQGIKILWHYSQVQLLGFSTNFHLSGGVLGFVVLRPWVIMVTIVQHSADHHMLHVHTCTCISTISMFSVLCMYNHADSQLLLYHSFSLLYLQTYYEHQFFVVLTVFRCCTYKCTKILDTLL